MLGYGDGINIDLLPLDYDILWDIPYEYPASDSYFIYTSRGCPRKCSFCAVKTLEPTFYSCNNVREQIFRVDNKFGTKRQLLIMDNNALYSDDFEETVTELVSLGFGTENNTVKKSNNMRYYMVSLRERVAVEKQYGNLLQRIKSEIQCVKVSRISNKDKLIINEALKFINQDNDLAFVQYLLKNEEYLVSFFERYHYHKIKRYVDYNQGLDARFFTEQKAQILSKLAIKPCRIAFDDIHEKDAYLGAIFLASQKGISHFSNYLLYNYKEHPTDLWKRLYLNVSFCEENSNIKSLFSFPMKYASIEHTDRSYVGKYWNKKYLKSMNVILNVTSGVVAKEKDFFLRAFGNNENEFLEILAMPFDFIRYRDYFEKNGLIKSWIKEYRRLSEKEIEELINLLSKIDKEKDAQNNLHSDGLKNILAYYAISKKSMSQNKEYYVRMFNLKENY